MPRIVKIIMSMADACTEFLNWHSDIFKESEDQRMIDTYDVLKGAFQKVRLIWNVSTERIM